MHLQAGFQAGPHRIDAPAVQHGQSAAHGLCQRGHHTGKDDAFYSGCLATIKGQHARELNRIFICGPRAVGMHTRTEYQTAAVIPAQKNLRVAYIHSQQHKCTTFFLRVCKQHLACEKAFGLCLLYSNIRRAKSQGFFMQNREVDVVPISR